MRQRQKRQHLVCCSDPLLVQLGECQVQTVFFPPQPSPARDGPPRETPAVAPGRLPFAPAWHGRPLPTAALLKQLS
ncbi:unnamed protein product [Rangifer tarandus platyrhynchus]|uniref:Uncharacterized protein n=1 Tax=Rangifer tarandus platyrhynchus TaxID=3082113 RepID=A0AC59ZSC4_RANTA